MFDPFLGSNWNNSPLTKISPFFCVGFFQLPETTIKVEFRLKRSRSQIPSKKANHPGDQNGKYGVIEPNGNWRYHRQQEKKQHHYKSDIREFSEKAEKNQRLN